MTESHDAAEIIEIRDPAIDSESIMRRIRDNIQKRRAQAESQGMNYDAFVEGLYAPNVGSRFNYSLYYDLRRMSVASSKLGVGLELSESHIPLIGPWVQRVRMLLHRRVIFYVNMLAGQQSRYNEYAVHALCALVKDLEGSPQPSELEDLRNDVAELRARIATLEAELVRARA